MMRVYVGRDDIAPSSDRWYATPHGMDFDVPMGVAATPLMAIANLLWRLDIEDIEPADCDIVWE